jgi:[acyl-carrier-protein] S-malonyltransferase
MADPWTSHDVGRAVLEEASEALGRDLVEGCRDDSALSTTEFVQPALLACDVAAYRAIEEEGLRVDAAAGHSLGEFAALVAAGVLEFGPALGVVIARGRAMQMASNARPGTMTALIGVGPDEAARICEVAGRGDALAVANENASDQVVLSGTPDAIERAEEQARSRGARAIRLNVAGAFHSPLMQPAVEPIREALAQVEFHEGRFPIVANLTGRFTREPAALRDALAHHVVSPVRWQRSMETFVDSGYDLFVEAGPGRVLTKLTKRGFEGVRAATVGSPEEAIALAHSAAEEAVP